MPKQSGRGKIVRHVTIKTGKNTYKRCDVYSKSGPKGGKTVCGPTRTKKKSK